MDSVVFRAFSAGAASSCTLIRSKTIDVSPICFTNGYSIQSLTVKHVDVFSFLLCLFACLLASLPPCFLLDAAARRSMAERFRFSQAKHSCRMNMATIKSTNDLTKEELEDYKEAFNNFDKDGNGNIDEGELGVVLRSLGYSPTNQQLKDMMKRVRQTPARNMSIDPRLVRNTHRSSHLNVFELFASFVQWLGDGILDSAWGRGPRTGRDVM